MNTVMEGNQNFPEGEEPLDDEYAAQDPLDDPDDEDEDFEGDDE